MRKVEILPTRDCEAGYGPAYHAYCRAQHLDFVNTDTSRFSGLSEWNGQDDIMENMKEKKTKKKKRKNLPSTVGAIGWLQYLISSPDGNIA